MDERSRTIQWLSQNQGMFKPLEQPPGLHCLTLLSPRLDSLWDKPVEENPRAGASVLGSGPPLCHMPAVWP